MEDLDDRVVLSEFALQVGILYPRKVTDAWAAVSVLTDIAELYTAGHDSELMRGFGIARHP